jgi:hypothetical protein
MPGQERERVGDLRVYSLSRGDNGQIFRKVISQIQSKSLTLIVTFFFIESVCELDIMFNLEKAHMILDEMVANGVVFDANKVRN